MDAQTTLGLISCRHALQHQLISFANIAYCIIMSFKDCTGAITQGHVVQYFKELYLKHNITNFSTLLIFNNLFQAVMCMSKTEYQRASFYGSCFNNHIVMFFLIPTLYPSCEFDLFDLMTT